MGVTELLLFLVIVVLAYLALGPFFGFFFTPTPRYEKRILAQPPCGPACGNNFTGWTAEEVEAYNETHEVPANTRGVLPGPVLQERSFSFAKVQENRTDKALPSPKVVEGKLRDKQSLALPEGQRDTPIHSPAQERMRVRRG